jgi:glycosyltransferase involved in cell wall biosynthesis
MRILLTIHHELDPDSGAPGTTLRLAEEYQRHGHEVELADFRRLLPGRLPEQAKMVAFPWALTAWLGRMRYRFPFDVIDASTGDAWIVGSIRRAFPAGRQNLLVVRSHGLEHTFVDRRRAEAAAGGEPLSWKYSIYHGGYRLWEVARSLRTADVVLFLNGYDRTVGVDRLGVAPSRARVVRNGISDALIGLPPPQPSGAGGRIAVIGSYITMKGIAHAAAALNAWLPNHPDWGVTFFGTGLPEARLLANYNPALHGQISVVERYANPELPRLLRGHQVYLFPTLSEGGPVSLVEAMACGLAPVASAVPGPAGIVRDGHDGLLVQPASPEAIVVALDRLGADPALLDRLRGHAHLTAQSYGWGVVAREQLAIYQEHIERKCNGEVAR